MDFKNTNPAVVKSMFLRMEKNILIEHMKLLKKELLELEVCFKNANYRRSLISLCLFSKHVYIQKFTLKK